MMDFRSRKENSAVFRRLEQRVHVDPAGVQGILLDGKLCQGLQVGLDWDLHTEAET
jgi:hypothetical protein